MPVWYSKPRFSTGSTVTLSPGAAAASPSSTAPSRRRSAPRPFRQIEAIEGGAGRGGRAGRGEQPPQQRPGLARGRGDRRGVLVVERCAQGGRARAVDAVGLGDRRHQGRQGEVDGQTGHAERCERLAGHRDRLDIGLRARRADQLGADLADLALRPDLGAFDPQHLARIAQPQRPRRVAEPGRGDAGDLRRHVGAHPDHAVRDRVHQAEGGRRHRRPGAREQCLLEFDERRLDPLIAMRRQARHQPRHDGGLEFRLGRQQIVHAGRQQRRMSCLAHIGQFASRSAQRERGRPARMRAPCSLPGAGSGPRSAGT